jgi:transcriptional regulator with XRE-family HTH domain
MGIGARLRDARKQAGLTIQDLSARTKIQPPILGAIEHGDFEHVPVGPVRRGFLRAYAREVGLEPEAVVREYLAEFEPQPARPDTSRAAGAAFTPGSSSRAIPSGPWLVAVIAIALLFLISYLRTDPPPPPLDAHVVPAIGLPSSEPFGGPDVARAGLTGTAADAPREGWLSLDMEARETIWIEATADGLRAFYRLVEAGDHVRLDAREEIVVRLGDAAAVEYSINGVPGRTLGGPGQVVTLRITADNYETFQASR